MLTFSASNREMLFQNKTNILTENKSNESRRKRQCKAEIKKKKTNSNCPLEKIIKSTFVD